MVEVSDMKAEEVEEDVVLVEAVQCAREPSIEPFRMEIDDLHDAPKAPEDVVEEDLPDLPSPSCGSVGLEAQVLAFLKPPVVRMMLL